MKLVVFYTKEADQEKEIGRVWKENGELKGTVNEIFLNDLRDWLLRSGESIDEYLEGLHQRFDGDFLYAGLYKDID
jgi:hypothetical protein